MTYSVESADETIATASVSEDVITVVPLAAGVVFITVTARDAGGGSGATTFTITVGAVLNIALPLPPPWRDSGSNGHAQPCS